MKLLAFDTATEMCSVALYIEGRVLVREQELSQGHGALLLPMIDGLLGEAGLALAALDVIAFGRGPGGFTGVRLAASVAQGLAYGAALPVLPISDLLAVAQRAFAARPAARRVLVCNDARMSEVYSAVFEREDAQSLPALCGAEQVLSPQAVRLPRSPRVTVGAGRGFRAYPQLRAQLGSQLAEVFDDLLPTAQSMLPQALSDWRQGLGLAAAAAQPVYLRDNVARPAVT